jgi:chemotaxis protein MotA
MKKGGPDSSTVLGLALGFGGILVGYLLEGGSPGGLVGFSALIIIITGTLGALMTSFGIKEILSIIPLLKDAMTSSKGPTKETVVELVSFAEKARREGLLALEDDIEHLPDPFLQKGIRMVVDGVDPDIVRNTLENDVYLYEQRRKEEAAIFDTAGGFSPTMGIIGTVMGLVLVLANLGGDARALGHSIATAFIATLYGIGLANLFWLPVGNKLKLKMKKDILEMECIMTGLQSLQSGDNPALIKDRLVSYLEEGAKFDEIEPSQP